MLTSVFGLPIKYEKWDKESSIPLYIAGGYEFYTAYIEDVRCIVLVPTEELVTLPALKKQITKIQQIDSVPVVFYLPSISFYRRKSLIENRIPFITEKQVFLPFIGTLLMEENEIEKSVEKFAFSTQQLFLYYLYHKKRKLYVAEAARILPFTAMTMTRAVRQLEATGLFSVTKDGVNKVIEAKYEQLELFEMAKRYLCSPVRKAGYIEKSEMTSDMVLAGETALAEKTMLNQGRVLTYAISEKVFDKKKLRMELIEPDCQIRLEIWAYDPKQFTNDNVADNLSVILSLMESENERIEQAVSELTERELGNYDKWI